MPNTQGMGSNEINLSFSQKAGNPNEVPPMAPHQRNVFSEREREELKQIIREALCDI